MRSCLALVAALWVVGGCAKGSIKLEDQDKFGKVKSAVWFEWTQEREGEDRKTHSFMAASQRGVCPTMQAAIPEVTDAYQDLLDELYGGITYGDTDPTYSDYSYDTGGYYGGGGPGQSLCELYKTYLERVATALDPMMDGGVNLLSFTLRDPDDDADEEPPTDDYEAGYDRSDPYFTGALSYYEENPYRVAADDMDCSGNSWYNDFYDAFDDIDIYPFDDGDLEAKQLGSGEAYKIKMDGDLEEEDGDDGGDIAFKGTFTKCEVSYQGDFSLYGMGFGGGSYYSSYSTYSGYSGYGTYDESGSTGTTGD